MGTFLELPNHRRKCTRQGLASRSGSGSPRSRLRRYLIGTPQHNQMLIFKRNLTQSLTYCVGIAGLGCVGHQRCVLDAYHATPWHAIPSHREDGCVTLGDGAQYEPTYPMRLPPGANSSKSIISSPATYLMPTRNPQTVRSAMLQRNKRYLCTHPVNIGGVR